MNPMKTAPVRIVSTASQIKIAGLQPLSTIDWPGKLAAVLFLQGCPYKCPYCHNFEILDPQIPGLVPWEEVLELLRRRQGLLDGIVFSGGEATMQPVLVDAAKQIKELGFKVGLHTAGAYPRRVEQLLEAQALDWVGLDIKALPEDYADVASSPVAGQKAEQTLDLLVAAEAKVAFEVRLTLWRGNLEYAVEVARWCKERGAKTFALQRLSTQNLPPSFQVDPACLTWEDTEARGLLEEIGFEQVIIR